MANVNCPHCSLLIVEDPQLAGQVVSCPTCQGRFQMPVAARQEAPRADSSSILGQPGGPPTGFQPANGTVNVYINHPPKSPGLAAVLSFFWCGLGQIYNGQIGLGVFLIVIQVVNVFLCLLIIGFFLYFATWIFSMINAYTTAEAINRQALSGQGALYG